MKHLNPQLEKLEQRIAPDLIDIGIGIGVDIGDSGTGSHEGSHHSS